MAPEVLNNRQYSYKADIWSLGVTLFECALGYMPYDGRSRDEIYSAQLYGKYLIINS